MVTASVLFGLPLTGEKLRALNGVLLILMLVFIAVQYNDPDGALWMAIYAVPAIWATIALFRTSWLGNKLIHFLLLFCLFVAAVGVIYFWPTSPGWWRQDVWWEVETAREGMGMMIVVIVLMVVWFSRPRSSNTPDELSG